VLAEALDRISRDQVHVAAFFKQMSFAAFVSSRLRKGHVGLKGTMNALFLKDLGDKTRRGLRGGIEQGRSGGGLCYGYRITKSEDGEHGGREIDEAGEASVVRRIFADFATGKSPGRIATELTVRANTFPAVFHGHNDPWTGLSTAGCGERISAQSVELASGSRPFRHFRKKPFVANGAECGVSTA
jgi:site-specific DNA recombinase